MSEPRPESRKEQIMEENHHEAGRFPESTAPYPGWALRKYHVRHPVTKEDIDAILGNEDLYLRESGSEKIFIIQKYGLLEINVILGSRDLQVWLNPEKEGFSADYLESLLSTRF